MQFKSYYVVWKPNLYAADDTPTHDRLNRTMQYGNYNEVCNKRIRKCQFKSYYVVWKPNKMGNSMYAYRKFKSYYVVWKPNRRKNLSL